MAFDPQAAAQDWSTNLAAAGPKMARGIAAVSTAPGVLAARNKAQYIAGVQAAQDKWARNTAGVSLSDWQSAATNKGLQRVASGAAAAQPKMAAFLQKVAPHINAGVNALPARGGLEANLQRANQFARHMATFSNK